jgi:hypothetical protein
MTARLATTLSLLFSTAPLGGQTAEAEPVIARVLEAYGGEEALRGARSYGFEGTIEAHARGGETGTVVRVSQGSGSLGVEIRYDSRSELRLLDEGQALRGTSTENLSHVEGPLQGAMVLQDARADLPWILMDHRDAVRLAGEDPTVLELDIPDGGLLRVIVDEETHTVQRSESVIEWGQTQLTFATDFSDFRSVDGVLFPYREDSWAQGVHTATITVTRLLIDPSPWELRISR